MNNSRLTLTDQNGNSISKEELSKSTGTFNYAIHGIEDVPDTAKVLHNRARQFGQKGDYKNAIIELEKAHQETPHWAYPIYDLAYTYLLQDDYENALKYYQLTDQMAPRGFYTSKTALHTLEREKTGDLKTGLYKFYISLEWIMDPEEKKETTKLLVSNYPTFAPGWNLYSNFLKREERLKALENGLTQNPDIDTQGGLLINKALVLNLLGSSEEAYQILVEIIFNPKSTYGNVELAKFVLNNISEK